MEKNYDLPPIAWLKMTDYMHGWMQWELGGGARIKDQKVVCVQDLPGARDALMMETMDDIELGPMKIVNAMSGNRKNMLAAGLVLDEGVIEREYGMTKKMMALFVPIECPRRCLTKYGVLRPWSLDICLGRQQASELQRVIRAAFWKAVEQYNTEYARKMNGRKYPAVDMIEDFCVTTKTPDIYVEAIRREWQRRLKNGQNRDIKPKKRTEHVSLLDL